MLNIHEHGSSDAAYEVTPGLMRDEAIGMFRQFYNGENERGEWLVCTTVLAMSCDLGFNFFLKSAPDDKRKRKRGESGEEAT